MHCAFEGCIKKLGELWFSAKYNNGQFSISHLVGIVDYKLALIKPPYYVPRPIKTHFPYWKANELKNWGLYYALLVVQNILKEDYFDHFKYFVIGI